MLKYYDFSGVSFLVEKSFECENASENAAERFVQPGTLIPLGADPGFGGAKIEPVYSICIDLIIPDKRADPGPSGVFCTAKPYLDRDL